MKKVIKVSVIVLAVSLGAGCATNEDVEKLQSQVNGVDASVKQASADAASAQTQAAAAEAAANRATELSQEANSKLDKNFKRSMRK
jgi:outer membrane murein-binding lipoprotein Lpp